VIPTQANPWELLAGRSERVMAKALADAGVVLDALITDPPYSHRTHSGNQAAVYADGAGDRRKIAYDHWERRHVAAFVRRWHPLCRGWFVALTDHVLAPVWEKELERAGRYVFANIPVVIPGMTVRTSGDGHSTESVWCIAARPRTKGFASWGTLPGWYKSTGRDGWSRQMGSKPLDVMGAILRDHSRIGDLVGDPCAGGGTTVLAAVLNGRRGIGCDMDKALVAEAREAIARRAQPSLLASIAESIRTKQEGEAFAAAEQAPLFE
jgi:hypothetical protein